MKENTRYRLLLILIFGSFFVPLFFINTPDSWSFQGSNQYILYKFFGSYLGYYGLMLLSWMYILGSRVSASIFFNDLPKISKLHKQLGKYGVLLIFIHPIMMAYYLGQTNGLYALSFNFSDPYEQMVNYGRIAFLLLLIIWLTSVVLRKKLIFRPWKYIHYLVYLVAPLALVHAWLLGPNSDNLAKMYFLTVISAVLAVFGLLRLVQLFGINKYKYVVLKNVSINTEVSQITLRPVLKKIGPKKGQYIYLQIRKFGEEHPFSVFYHKERNGDLVVTYKKQGRFTNKLANLTKNYTVLVEGPYGVFTSEINEQKTDKIIFVAGGIGITPFVNHLISRKSKNHWLFYANRSSKSAVFSDELRATLNKNFIEIYSEEKVDKSLYKEQGYFSQNILKKYIKNPEQFTYYVCGPKPMMDSVKTELKNTGVTSQNIKTEEFSL